MQVYDVTDSTDPTKLGGYDPDGYSFWTAVRARGFTIGGIYGASSTATAGGLVVLHEDRGQKRPPGFDGADHPDDPGLGAPDGP